MSGAADFVVLERAQTKAKPIECYFNHSAILLDFAILFCHAVGGCVWLNYDWFHGIS